MSVSILDALAQQRSIATELLPGDTHAQLIKLLAGDAGTAIPIKGSTNFGLYVEIRRTPRAENAPALSNVPINDASVVIAAANDARKGLFVYNDTEQDLKIAYAADAALDACSYNVPPGLTWEMPLPIYPGVISGIWPSEVGGGAARVTDLT